MSNWAERRELKHARRTLAAARKVLRINRDLLSSAQMSDIEPTMSQLERALAEGYAKEAGAQADELEQKVTSALPPQKHTGLRENVEVLLVALIVAMAVRTFFIQPFKIPTGSMQPTLYGIVEDTNCDPNAPALKRVSDSFGLGRWPSAPRRTLLHGLADFGGWVVFGRWPNGSRCLMRGDHIFVDKVSYHFRNPTRGEIIVFDTRHVPNPRGKFYIKRLISVGGDTVQIQPPYVLVNGEILDERRIFQRIYDRDDGYSGYVIPDGTASPEYLNSPYAIRQVRPGHLFVMGDNSLSSYDGRFWGDFPRTDLVGRAVVVYWPFSKRWGWID